MDARGAVDSLETEHLYKVLVIGDYGVGKTSIIRRFTQDVFQANYKLTIGVDFAVKMMDLEGKHIKLQMWDIAGHERFGHMTHVYYKYAVAAVLVFDLGRPATFESILKWHRDLNSKVELPNGDPLPVILLANKADLSPSELSKVHLDNFCKEHNILAWFPTSAKLNQNIDDAMQTLVKHIMSLPAIKPLEENSSLVDLNAKTKKAEEEKSPCCSDA
eukprot:m.212101 g.212101  ORF g.212101 m.212101 type:complete len:217 (+) comp19545_c0_seq1:133-783(+)